MTRGPVRRALLLAMAVALSTPAPTNAESALWTLTASPLAATTGVQTTYSLTATNEDPLAALSSNSEIGCVVLDVPVNFDVKGATVTGSNAGSGWHIDRIEGNRVFVHTDSGGERLEFLQWVGFTVKATATSAGSLAWSARAYRDTACTGAGALLGVPPVVVVSGPTVTPTPAPTASPTPTPSPTPLLPLPSASLPLPIPSLGMTPAPTPTPTRGQTSTPAPTPAPSEMVGAAGTTATPIEQPEPTGSADLPPSEGPPATGGGAAGPGASDPTALELVRVEFDTGDVELGLGSLDLIQGATTWAVPAATLAGPGLLLLLLVALQSIGALAWIPAVRRLRGGEEDQA